MEKSNQYEDIKTMEEIEEELGLYFLSKDIDQTITMNENEEKPSAN